MKLAERRLRRMRGDVVELVPTTTAYPAIVVSLDLESRWGEGKRRELRDRSGRQQRNHYPFGSDIEAGEACGPGEQNMRARGQLRLAHDNFMLGEVGGIQRR